MLRIRSNYFGSGSYFDTPFFTFKQTQLLCNFFTSFKHVGALKIKDKNLADTCMYLSQYYITRLRGSVCRLRIRLTQKRPDPNPDPDPDDPRGRYTITAVSCRLGI